MEKKPETVSAYRDWLKETHHVEIDRGYELYYDSVTSKAKRSLETSGFWTALTESLEAYNQEYELKTGYRLFIPKFELELLLKPFESFLLKTYRKNILENESWPKEPEGGWLLPSNWFSRINDIIRTLVVVKYFDGVEFAIDKIRSLCKQQNMECGVTYEAREEGYYAVHLCTKRSFEVPKINWDTEIVEIPIEIQITTQLQEVIRKLLHKYYDQRRKMIQKSIEKWQWDYRCDEFSANYLGHILHYVEGMIMEIREKQREVTP
jgi:ppGpp synthetase/RelA/SpoT-type nucleotidyltranferase